MLMEGVLWWKRILVFWPPGNQLEKDNLAQNRKIKMNIWKFWILKIFKWNADPCRKCMCTIFTWTKMPVLISCSFKQTILNVPSAKNPSFWNCTPTYMKTMLFLVSTLSWSLRCQIQTLVYVWWYLK